MAKKFSVRTINLFIVAFSWFTMGLQDLFSHILVYWYLLLNGKIDCFWAWHCNCLESPLGRIEVWGQLGQSRSLKDYLLAITLWNGFKRYRFNWNFSCQLSSATCLVFRIANGRKIWISEENTITSPRYGTNFCWRGLQTQINVRYYPSVSFKGDREEEKVCHSR